jgi:hypothetical protein
VTISRSLGRGLGGCAGALGSGRLPVAASSSQLARTDVLLYALEKEPFVTAVTGHAPAARAAEEVVREGS